MPGGEAGGEPLHFQRIRGGSLPGTDRGSSRGGRLAAGLDLSGGFRTHRYRAHVVPVRQAGYASEVLSVAPSYARPDSAAAARIQSEIARSRADLSPVAGTAANLAGSRSGFPAPAGSPVRSERPGCSTARSRAGIWAPTSPGSRRSGASGRPGVVALVADFYLAGTGGVPRSWGRAGDRLLPPRARSYVGKGDTVSRGNGSARWVRAGGSPGRTCTGSRGTARSRWIR